jgi:tetratricopeptide (TPR) repeat protein
MYQNAIDEYTEALNLVPYETSILYKRGEMYLKLGKTDEACKDWYKIQEFNKTFGDDMINKHCK